MSVIPTAIHLLYSFNFLSEFSIPCIGSFVIKNMPLREKICRDMSIVSNENPLRAQYQQLHFKAASGIVFQLMSTHQL